jgi:ATP-binding cassette subfamily F protein 3
MILLTAFDLKKSFGLEPVLDGVSLEIRAGEKIGLVGPNGAGKTTLLRILAGKDEPDGGTVAAHPAARLGHLEQQGALATGRTVWEEASSALAHLVDLAREAEDVSHELSEARDPELRDRLALRFDRLQRQIDRLEAHNFDHRVARVLDGVGFGPGRYEQPVATLSGGEERRLVLAKLLLSDADLLLLDEPSNHLDVAGTEWLEGFLAASRQAVIVASHDRYFLDKVTGRTLELFRGRLESYPGSFSTYWSLKAERVELERRAFEKQQVEIAKMEEFIRRNHYGEKHAQAEDRKRKLARIERVAPPREIAAPPMAFPPPARSGDIALRVEGLEKGYERPLFSGLTFDILRGERWGILGPNASGKTTLLRALIGEERGDAGKATPGSGVRFGYYDQGLSGLAGDEPLLEVVRPPAREKVMENQECRDLLARFGLAGDIVFQSVRSLSGGEQSRAALARLAAAGGNFLVLDEPTNHLDLWARDALEAALSRFGGTVLVVSHDRYFLNRIADHLIVFEPAAGRGEPHRVRVIEGNYDAYVDLSRRARGGEGGGEGPGRGAASARKERWEREKRSRAARPRRRFPYRKLADLEGEIFAREARLEELHAALARPEVLRDGERVRAIKAEIEAAKGTLPGLYEHWDEASALDGEE